MTKLSHKNYAGVLRRYFSKELFAVCILGIGILLLNGCIKKKNSGEDATGGAPTKTQTIQALKDFYKAADGDNWTVKWDFTKDYTTWKGLTVNYPETHGGVEYLRDIRITLPNNNLSGDIAAILQPLMTGTETVFLDLSNNKISGTLPTGIRKSKGMERIGKIILNNNQLSGSIPTDLFTGVTGELSNLNKLDLSNNQLTGNLPATTIVYSLFTLNLSHNQLSGTVPNYETMFLEEFNLSYNNFTGNIPEEIKSRPDFIFCPQNNGNGFDNCP